MSSPWVYPDAQKSCRNARNRTGAPQCASWCVGSGGWFGQTWSRTVYTQTASYCCEPAENMFKVWVTWWEAQLSEVSVISITHGIQRSAIILTVVCYTLLTTLTFLHYIYCIYFLRFYILSSDACRRPAQDILNPAPRKLPIKRLTQLTVSLGRAGIEPPCWIAVRCANRWATSPLSIIVLIYKCLGKCGIKHLIYPSRYPQDNLRKFPQPVKVSPFPSLSPPPFIYLAFWQRPVVIVNWIKSQCIGTVTKGWGISLFG
jgi:hypothetical protein